MQAFAEYQKPPLHTSGLVYPNCEIIAIDDFSSDKTAGTTRKVVMMSTSLYPAKLLEESSNAVLDDTGCSGWL